MFFSFAYSASRCSCVSAEYLGIRLCVRNLRRTTSIRFGSIMRHSSSSRTFARLPRAESLAVTTRIKLAFLNTISHVVPFILIESISASSSLEFGINSSRILSITATPWLRTPDAMQTLVSWLIMRIKHRIIRYLYISIKLRPYLHPVMSTGAHHFGYYPTPFGWSLNVLLFGASLLITQSVSFSCIHVAACFIRAL